MRAIDPPPAPTVCTSTVGMRSGNPSISDSAVNGTRPSQRQTSVEVPPISSVMMRSKPALFATRNAPTTPPAGPESNVRTASEPAAAAPALPPFDCITRSRFVPRLSRPSANFDR